MTIGLTKTVPTALSRRKKDFRIALAAAGMTAGQWAEKHGIDAAYLSRFLGGKTTSEPLARKIDAFTDRQLKQLGRTG